MVKAQLQTKCTYSRNVKFLKLDHFLFKGAGIMKLASVKFHNNKYLSEVESKTFIRLNE